MINSVSMMLVLVRRCSAKRCRHVQLLASDPRSRWSTGNSSLAAVPQAARSGNSQLKTRVMHNNLAHQKNQVSAAIATTTGTNTDDT